VREWLKGLNPEDRKAIGEDGKEEGVREKEEHRIIL
jgi:hypothetical protein